MHRAIFPTSARALLSVCLWLAPSIAGAQSAPLDPAAQAQAEALFSEGTTLLEAGDFAAACSKLSAAVELTRGEALGGKVMLARCFERSGKLASAWGLYTEVAAKAAKAGQSARASEAAAAAESLSPRLHRVALVVAADPSATPSLTIVLAGRTLAPGAWSTPLPVDAGPLEIVVSAEGKTPLHRRVEVPAEPGTTRVEVPALEDAPAAPPKETASRPAPEPEGSFWSGQRATGLVIGLTGVVGAGVGGALGFVAIGAYDDGLVEGGCTGSPPVCDDIQPVNDARALGDASTIVLFSGVGLAAVGAVLMLTAPNANVVGASAAPSVSIGPDHAFVSVSVAYD